MPRTTQTFGIGWLADDSMRMRVASAEGYLGIPLLVLAVALAVYAWSRRDWPSRLIRFLSVMLIFVLLAALGPEVRLEGHRVTGLPWAALWKLPIVHSAFPARFMVFAFLALAVMVALWLAGPSRQTVGALAACPARRRGHRRQHAVAEPA